MTKSGSKDTSVVARVFNALFITSMLFFFMVTKPKIFAGIVVVVFAFYVYKILSAR